MGGGREVHEGGDIYVPMADSCWCVAETNTILKSNYSPTENNFFFNCNVLSSRQSLGHLLGFICQPCI